MALFSNRPVPGRVVMRTSLDDNLSSYSMYPFYLDGCDWPSAEHYFHAMKFDDEALRAKVRESETPAKARKIGRSNRKKLRKDWRQVRTIVMTRAVYTKCKTYSNIAQELLDTGDCLIEETTNYDYFWGCGRDGLGENNYGKVLMNVRKRLTEDAEV